MKSTPTGHANSRSVSQILSRAGFPNAKVRRNSDGSYTIPAGASGYGCADTITGPRPGGFKHRWRSVEVGWYGDTEGPFAAMAEVLADRGYTTSPVDPRSINSGRSSITAWKTGDDDIEEEVDEELAAAQARYLDLLREEGLDEYYRPIPVA